MEWSSPPPHLQLSASDISIWRAKLDCDASVVTQLETTLSQDEKERAARFHFDRDRSHFIVARGVLRNLLGRYLAQNPGDIRFRYGPHGKPSLIARKGDPAIQFNLSHSQGIAIYAFGYERELGVDVESIRREVAGEDIAQRFFSTHEMQELLAIPAEQRAEGFLLCWTRKEAYIKARGEGLQIPLNSFDVSLTPGEPARFLRGVDRCWQLLSFLPADRCVGALAFQGQPANIQWFDFIHRNEPLR